MVRVLEDDDEHENEDDFSTSEFRFKVSAKPGDQAAAVLPGCALANRSAVY
jgi:hypothetical protein